MNSRPNILLAIADDQGWPHTGACGTSWISTPAFDKVAEDGVLFRRAYAPAPQCAPSRASLLSGRNLWQNREAGTHASVFPGDILIYTDILQDHGYHVGHTGKGWAPGNFSLSGRLHNPAGPAYNERILVPPTSCISRLDYASNFEDFLDANDEQTPFCFWFGCFEPHRPYEEESGTRAGRSLDEPEVPGYLPDDPIVRGDLLDYGLEIEWFDSQLARMLKILEERNLTGDTLVVVTSDNGLPFPRAKANNYDAGAHIPLAIRWPGRIPSNRRIDDFTTFIDLAPTFLEAAGIPVPEEMSGKSLLPILESHGYGLVDDSRTCAVTGRERHTHARFDNIGYPIRAIHTDQYLYIRNMEPGRWPAGEMFHDVDDGPTKAMIIRRRDEPGTAPYFHAAFDKRPLEELFNLEEDPSCMVNLAGNPEYRRVADDLWRRLRDILIEQGDPRVAGFGCLFDAYPRVSFMRDFLGGFSEQGRYNESLIDDVRVQLSGCGFPEDEINHQCLHGELPIGEDTGPKNR